MAAKEWRSGLNERGLFRVLREEKGEQSAWTKKQRSDSLVCVHETTLFAWHPRRQVILTANLNDESDQRYQTLLLTNPPLTPVHSVAVSPTAQFVALVGSGGVSVVHLPRRWGRGFQFDGGKEEKIVCRCVCVDERVLSGGGGQVGVLQIAWFPDLTAELAVLTSENELRIYNAITPEQAERVLTLGANSTFLRCLGDTAVSFDFAPFDPDRWTVFVLRGNGDVLSLSVDRGNEDEIGGHFGPKSSLSGPLTMHPPAEDNYGVDACAILCLRTTPPLLVVATASGTLYHCVVLMRADEAKTGESPFALYVVDNVELELSLTTRCVQTGDLEEDAFTCPIHLLADSTNPSRYHCSHAAGVHTVLVPFLTLFEEFVLSDSSASTSLSLDDQECVVEHVVCTKPLNNSPVAPVLGLCVVGGAHPCLICLTADFEVVVVSLVCVPCGDAPLLLTDGAAEPFCVSSATSSSDAFDVHIRSLLRRMVSHPILKSSAEAELLPQESLQLLLRATQVLRWEYIHRLDVVHDEIQSKVSHLRRVKNEQESQVLSLQQRRASMRQTAETLAERYEDACDRQSHLVARVEHVLRSIQRSLPIMSDAEHAMLKELRTLSPSVAGLESSLEQMKIKRKFQERYSEGQRVKGVNSSPSWVAHGTLSDVRKQQLYAVLKKQGVRLTELKKTLGHVKQQLGV